eukprot:2106000-Prymnesium_polylepis.1
MHSHASAHGEHMVRDGAAARHRGWVDTPGQRQARCPRRASPSHALPREQLRALGVVLRARQ